MTMTMQEAIFKQWAPPDGAWSAWAKPVLFAHLRPYATSGGVAPASATTSSEPVTGAVVIPSINWAAPADGATAIVVDLPSATGVHLGLALARVGYRPVPLYNAVPSPTPVQTYGSTTCEVGAIVQAIAQVTPELAALRLRPDAPPAFLLDARRSIGTTSASTAPGQRLFDDRSVSLPTDFPSANLLMSRGVRRVILVRQQWLNPQPDLAHTLLRWQQAGIRIEAIALETPDAAPDAPDAPDAPAAAPAAPTPIVVRRPPMYRLMLQRLLATLGLRRHPLGGFGGLLPEEGWGSGSVG